MTSDPKPILCADDFAMSRPVSDAIISLAEENRLSATSAMVTTGEWPSLAKSIMRLRNRLAIGLHLNLTFGRSLGPLCKITPDGLLPSPVGLIKLILIQRIESLIAAEIELQLARFENEAGFPPDFVDGHHHVHILPGFRHIVVDALDKHLPNQRPLLRDPSDHPLRIFRRCIAVEKALSVTVLATGFRQLAAAHGYPVNRGFSGFSNFGTRPYHEEFESFIRFPGPCHMIMCHPGLSQVERRGSDTIAQRRHLEYAFLSTRDDIPSIICHPTRLSDDSIAW